MDPRARGFVIMGFAIIQLMIAGQLYLANDPGLVPSMAHWFSLVGFLMVVGAVFKDSKRAKRNH